MTWRLYSRVREQGILLSAMRRASFLVYLILPGLLAFPLSRAHALTEAEIQAGVTQMQSALDADLNAANTFTCGGLLSTTDSRVLAHYARRPDLACTPTEWCTNFNELTGACTGSKCLLKQSAGMPDRTILQSCDANGNCAPPPGPRRSCDFPYFQSRARKYECALLPFAGSPANVGTAQAECFTYLPDLQYAESYYPFAYNCVVTYSVPPADVVDSQGETDPKGQLSLIPPLESSPSESNLTTPSLQDSRVPKDSSIQVLDLQSAVASVNSRVMHPDAPISTKLTDYPDLSAYIEDLLQPPEVRLILPKGGLGIDPIHSLFSRMHQLLGNESVDAPVMRTLGSNPDALHLAAEYLRSIPLLETRYVPVHVLVPATSSLQLKQKAEEWRTWKAETEQLASGAGTALDPAVASVIQGNIDALYSYIALEQSVRNYRTHFPEYLNALLSYAEQSNTFFHEKWAKENADRLDAWALAFRTYLPAMRTALRALYKQAATFTQTCQVPACRLDTIPVKAGIKPWNLISKNSEIVFQGQDRAWLPEGQRVWENEEGHVLQWHPFLSLGTPLPDLTLDFSEIFLRRTVDIPVLIVESHTLDLPSPPPIDRQKIAEGLSSLKAKIQPLPVFHPPLFDLSFPDLTLPDPATSLLLVPEAPKALDTWVQALQWRKDRLTELTTLCDKAPKPLIFLAHEFQLYGSTSDPSARRATSFVPWAANTSPFPVAWFPWTGWPSWFLFPFQGIGGVSHLPPLLTPPLCADCGNGRTQRYIRQHVELDTEWQSFQDHVLRAIDAWNAEVRYFSVVPRDELEGIHEETVPLWRNFLPATSP